MSTAIQPATGPELRRALVAPMEGLTLRESGSGDGTLHLAGHAAVFNRLSHDLGGFRERIAPGAFTRVLDADPDVHLVVGHDPDSAMASLRNKTLELREDPQGLRVWARLDPADFDVQRMRRKVERGDVSQMSFAFTVGRDTWEIDEREEITRTIHEIDGLFDVSVVAQGAYPQTDVNLRGLLEAAIESGRVPLGERANPESVAPPGAGDSPDPSLHQQGGEFERRRRALAVRVRLALAD